MTLEQQQKIVEHLFVIKSDLSSRQIMDIGKIMWGIEFTASSIRRAHEAVDQEYQSKTFLSDKFRYLQALVTLYPNMSLSALTKRSKQYFNETTRPDVMAELREHHMDIEEAQQIILRVEKAVHQNGMLPAELLV